MIRYSLKCRPQGHEFESWFASAAAYDSLARAKSLSCPHCGSSDVEKSLMTPGVALSREAALAPSATAEGAKGAGPLSTPVDSTQEAMAAMQRALVADSDYVGERFVHEARAMHLGDAPQRAIHGEARLDEAKALIEEGVAVIPLPFQTDRKLN